MEQIIAFLTGLIIQVIEKSGYAGVFLLMTAESALIPIPSEVTMPFAGYLASIGKFNIYGVILIGAMANLTGSLVAYFIGYHGGEQFVRNLIKKYGKFLLITEGEYERSETWFRKYGQKVVFVSRVLPIVRTFISLPAGVYRMKIWRFTYLTFIGSLLWSTFLTYVGFTLGKNWHSLEPIYRKFEYVVVAVVVIVVGHYLYHKLKKLFRRKHS